MRGILYWGFVFGLALACEAQDIEASMLDRALDDGPYAAEAQAFYAERGHEPLWTRPASSDLSAPGHQLVDALARAGDDGLVPDDYLAPLPADPTRREAALTRAFLTFCEHLMQGRVTPRSVHRDWLTERRRLDAGEALRLAARSGPEASIWMARPPHLGYARLRDALARLRAQSQTPWSPIPEGPPLKQGDADSPALGVLRDRLVALGNLESRRDGPFDTELDEAVRRFQERFGLEVDGVVGPATRSALNRTPADWAHLVSLNMERWRWLPADLGTRHVWIDVAGMTTALVERGREVWTARTIVGTTRTPTPGFTSTITHVVLSPYWNIPESIARAEIRPRIARDPRYLARHHMERLPGGALRQRPGPDNPLGPVKFIFETPFGVRLHGTSSPSLYEVRVRTFSHGCIRVEDPLELADRLLPDLDSERIQAVVAAQNEEWVELQAPLPIYSTYWTAHVDSGGALRFRHDIYGRDRALTRRLGVSPAR
ncbi:MAG: L,D-transpeptidase family protein [Bacteroidota bacterium]